MWHNETMTSSPAISDLNLASAVQVPSVLAKANDGQLEHDRLTSLINSMADGVITVDKFTNIAMCNGAALNILDSNTSLQGQPLDKALNVIDGNNQSIDIIEFVRSIKIPTVNESFRLRYPDDSSICLYLSVSPVTHSYGATDQKERSGYVIVIRDITRAKSLEEERDEFISVVSHELRTPIAIAEGNISNAQFVIDKADCAACADNIARIKQALRESHEQVLFLAAMINDLSTLSRAERGRLNAEIDQVNVHQLMRDLAASYSDDAIKKGLKLLSEIDPSLELLASSRLYVREVLQNFITNAIKYTEAGSVTISAKPQVRGSGNGVLFVVSDTGIGISRSDQEKVFDKFFRSEDFRTRENSGTGLGLYITMKLARILHAEIDVTSQINHGSTFMIYIPNLQ